MRPSGYALFRGHGSSSPSGFSLASILCDKSYPESLRFARVVDVLPTFFLVSTIIFVGFLAALGFDRFKVPDIVILLLLGVLIGPVLNLLGAPVLAGMRDLSPFFGTLVLIILLVEGGMRLDQRVVLKQAATAVVFTLLAFVLTVAAVAGVAMYAGWPLLHGVLLGAILGGNSSSVIFSLMRTIGVREETRTLLSLESSINDALTIILTVSIVQIILGGAVADPGGIARDFFGSFTISALFAVAAAIFWIRLLHWLSTPKYNYVLTLAAVLFLYVLAEGAKSSGAFAALVFGIMLGNSRTLGPLIGAGGEASFLSNLHVAQEEITFFVRTFFFVFMGLILDLEGVTLVALGLAGAIIVVKFFARYAAAVSVSGPRQPFRKDRAILAAMLPNGLAAAAMATYPASAGVAAGGAASFQDVAVLVILFSNVFAGFVVFVVERGRPRVATLQDVKRGEAADTQGTVSTIDDA